MDPFPPDCAEKYRPLRQLARGGFGSVWLAEQIGLEREVAVKILHTDLLTRAHDVDRFLAEARVTAKLAHPHIVRVLDHGVEHDVPWMALELLPGRTLAEMLAGGALPWADALAIAAQVASALEGAHAHGVLHRDIKPSNILEVSKGQVKVADFGIAKWNTRVGLKTETGVIMGTPQYLAPEVVEGKPASEASDLYALGVVLFEMLVGRAPFQHSSPLTLLNLHRTETVPLPSALNPELPAGIDALVLRLLAKAPGERYAGAAETREALERFRPADAAPRRSRAPKPTSPPEAGSRRPARARALLVAGVVAAALGLTVGFAIRFARTDPDSPSPPRPSASVRGLAPEDRAALERKLEWFARHVALDPLFKSIRSTLSETTPDLVGGVKLARDHEAREGALFREVSEVSDRIERDVPMVGAAFADARLFLRARGYRYVMWRRRMYCRRHAEIFQYWIDQNEDNVFSLVDINVQVSEPADHADGLAFAKRFLDAAGPVLRAVPDELAGGGAGFADVMDDVGVVAREIGWTRFTPDSRAKLDGWIEAFKRGLAADQRPHAYAVARLVSTLWEMRDGPQPTRRSALALMAAEELKMLKRQAPAAEAEVQRLQARVEAETKK